MTDEIILILDNITVNKRNGEFAVYKPLLLLIILDMIKNNADNKFAYIEIRPQLLRVMEKYGWQTKGQKQAEYPFLFLASSVIWEINIDPNSLKHKKSPTAKEMEPAIGKLNDKIYNFLREQPAELEKVKKFLSLKYFGQPGIQII